MKSKIVAEIDRIAGDRLTLEMREEIADRAAAIIEEHGRVSALAAIETVKKTIVQASQDSAAAENDRDK